MPTTLEPVRPIQLAEIRQARERIAQTIVRTPLIRLELGPGRPDVRLKLENLQPISAYKLRGAANAVALLREEDRKRGVWTISAGNAGQGVAYAARKAGVPCTVVVIETAPASKRERMKALGARLVPVPYEVAWQALEDRAFPGVEGTFVHPFDDQDFITGHATMGLEILEDVPDAAAVIAAIGGGGLITGVGSAVKALKPEIKVWALNRRPPPRWPALWPWGLLRSSGIGRLRSSMAPADRASSRACGNACSRWWTVASWSAWKRRSAPCASWRRGPGSSPKAPGRFHWRPH